MAAEEKQKIGELQKKEREQRMTEKKEKKRNAEERKDENQNK